MDNSQRLSEVLYVGLCHKIGTPTEVCIRRDVKDMEDMIHQKISKRGGMMLSGSRREGFRLNTSDKDYMMWCCHCKVINDISQLSTYDPSKHSIFLMEDTYTPPGFVRLQLLTMPTDIVITSSMVPLNDRIYLSNVLYKQAILKEKYQMFQNLIDHGPCLTKIDDSLTIDAALCFASKYWPKNTESWKDRCRRHTWPPASVLKDILNNNCHCVAIGSKCTLGKNELEWRLSFSLAEQKLVYSMNHTQFLCYGLLKIFLSEVIIKNVEEPLLCSYFMKTTMFWLIQVGQLSWCPNKLLKCFWTCFRYLVHCVNRGKFPNFFIPQNNMFMNKVVGAAQESLLEHLTQYYSLGVSCVLQSPTLRSILEPALSCPPSGIPLTGAHNFDLTSGICHCCKDRGATEQIYDVSCQCCIKDIINSELRFYDLVCHCCIKDRIVSELFDISFGKSIDYKICFFFLKSLNILLRLPNSQYQSLTLQYCTADVLSHIPFFVFNKTSYFKNKHAYCLERNLSNILKLSSKIGTVTHSLYLAMYYYRTGKYNEALHISNLIKEIFLRIRLKRRGIEDERYREEISAKTTIKRMIIEIMLRFEVHYIEELIFEDREKEKYDKGRIVSPFVLAEMLSVLSNYRLGNKPKYLKSLSDLHALFLPDNENYDPFPQRCLSWYIFGVCQQVVGDFHGALQAYQEALKHTSDDITKRTIQNRIKYIHQQQFIFCLLWYTCSLSYTSYPKTI